MNAESVQQPYRLKVRVGDSEFEAEGPEDTVKEQFQLFLDATKATTFSSPSKEKPTGNGANRTRDDDPLYPAQDDLVKRAFVIRDNNVSLRVLPPDGEVGDCLVLLLYGYQVLTHKQDVPASDLMASLRQSGIQRDRIDRDIPLDFVNRGGRKSGTRYSLNNRGIGRAQELLEGMFQ